MMENNDIIRAKAKSILLDNILKPNDSKNLKRLNTIVERTDTINAMIEFAKWYKNIFP